MPLPPESTEGRLASSTLNKAAQFLGPRGSIINSLEFELPKIGGGGVGGETGTGMQLVCIPATARLTTKTTRTCGSAGRLGVYLNHQFIKFSTSACLNQIAAPCSNGFGTVRASWVWSNSRTIWFS